MPLGEAAPRDFPPSLGGGAPRELASISARSRRDLPPSSASACDLHGEIERRSAACAGGAEWGGGTAAVSASAGAAGAGGAAVIASTASPSPFAVWDGGGGEAAGGEAAAGEAASTGGEGGEEEAEAEAEVAWGGGKAVVRVGLGSGLGLGLGSWAKPKPNLWRRRAPLYLPYISLTSPPYLPYISLTCGGGELVDSSCRSQPLRSKGGTTWLG